MTDALLALSSCAEQAQLVVQRTHPRLDPVIGINRSLRQQGYAVDLLTIDCLISQQRLTFLLDDNKTGRVAYSAGPAEETALAGFTEIPLEQVSVDQLVTWILDTFSH